LSDHGDAGLKRNLVVFSKKQRHAIKHRFTEALLDLRQQQYLIGQAVFSRRKTLQSVPRKSCPRSPIMPENREGLTAG